MVMLGKKKSLMLQKNTCKLSNLIKITEPKGQFSETHRCVKCCVRAEEQCRAKPKRRKQISYSSMALTKKQGRHVYSCSPLKYLSGFESAGESDSQGQESELNNRKN